MHHQRMMAHHKADRKSPPHHQRTPRIPPPLNPKSTAPPPTNNPRNPIQMVSRTLIHPPRTGTMDLHRCSREVEGTISSRRWATVLGMELKAVMGRRVDIITAGMRRGTDHRDSI